jgi:hypothetical protein
MYSSICFSHRHYRSPAQTSEIGEQENMGERGWPWSTVSAEYEMPRVGFEPALAWKAWSFRKSMAEARPERQKMVRYLVKLFIMALPAESQRNHLCKGPSIYSTS